MKMRLMFLFLVFVCSLIVVSAHETYPSDTEVLVGYDFTGTNSGKVVIDIPETPINYSSKNTNSSDYWNTSDYGALRAVSDIFHNWLDATSLLWSNSGHTIDTDLDMNANDILLSGGGSILDISHIAFNLTPDVTHGEGVIHWNSNDGTMEIGMPGGNVRLQVGQEHLIRAINKEGVNLDNCRVVYVSGASADFPEVKLSDYKDFQTVKGTIGLTTELIIDNQKGYVNTQGIVRGCDTAAFAEGASLYLAEDGLLTDVFPESPNGTIFIGIAIRSHSTEGTILNLHDVLPYIEDLSNVNGYADTTNQILFYNNDTRTWELTLSPTFENITIEGEIVGGKLFTELDKNSLIDGSVYGLMMTNPPNQELPHLIVQSGGSSQSSVFLRSLMIANEINDFHNTTNRTDCIAYMDEIGETLKIDCNTTTTGADLLVSDDMQVVGDVWLKDTDEEWHFMTRELELLDEMRKNTLLSSINMSLSGITLSIEEAHGKSLVVNLNEYNEILDRVNDSISLTKGTNLTPIFNFVYYDYDGDDIILKKDTQQLEQETGIGMIMMGDGIDYGSIKGGSSQNLFTKKNYLDSWYRSEVYQDGLDISVDSGTINISTGTLWLLMDEHEINLNHSTDDLVINIGSTGGFGQISNLDSAGLYSTGEIISNNKYFNVVCSIVTTINEDGRMYCMPQNMPPTEHTKLIDAETDIQHVVYTPNHPFISKLSTPVVRVVIQRTGGTNTIQQLTTYGNEYYVDLRGGDFGASGASSTTGITSLSQLNIDTNYEGTGYNMSIDSLFLDDNQKIYFGNDDDASITYDGADLIIDSSLVGTGNIDMTGAYLTFTQKADSQGLVVYGYDDKVGNYYSQSINSGGTAKISSNGGMSFTNTGVGDIQFLSARTGGDVFIDPQDKFYIRDVGNSYATTLRIYDLFVNLPLDNQKLTQGAAYDSDYYQSFDGTNMQYFTSGIFDFTGDNLTINNEVVCTAENELCQTGFTGTCINVTYSGGLAISCND